MIFCDLAAVTRALLLSLLLLTAAPAAAADLVVQVRTVSGQPVPNAVVSLYPGGQPVPIRGGPRAFQIRQRDLQFSPFVLVVPVGAQVSFPNQDPVRHHVYSFSQVRRFELRLFARQQSRSVLFDRPGIVPIGCNIHDNMIAFIAVSDTAFATTTDGSGRALFADAPAGAAVARIWHPYLRAPANRLEQRWTVPASGRHAQAVAVSLRAPAPAARTY